MPAFVHLECLTPFDPFEVDAEVLTKLTDADLARYRALEREPVLVAYRDREILTRFYLQEQTQEEICAEMNLSDTQFRLLKSRAKARFGELGRKKLARRKFF